MPKLSSPTDVLLAELPKLQAAVDAMDESQQRETLVEALNEFRCSVATTLCPANDPSLSTFDQAVAEMNNDLRIVVELHPLRKNLQGLLTFSRRPDVGAFPAQATPLLDETFIACQRIINCLENRREEPSAESENRRIAGVLASIFQGVELLLSGAHGEQVHNMLTALQAIQSGTPIRQAIQDLYWQNVASDNDALAEPHD